MSNKYLNGDYVNEDNSIEIKLTDRRWAEVRVFNQEAAIEREKAEKYIEEHCLTRKERK